MSKYYCLVAGLPDISLDDGKLTYTVANFKSDIYPELSVSDRKLVDLFFLKYDNSNLLKLLQDREAIVDPRGNYSADELIAFIVSVKEGETPVCPSYIPLFISDYLQKVSTDEYFVPEDCLANYYYAYAMECHNAFISSWFEFNLNINNVLTALTARKYKFDVASNIVGCTDLSNAIRTSNARDFGLTGTLEYLDQLMRISETEELVEKEKKIDVLKWNWMEDATFFDYFTIERIFVFLLKLEMIERWISLDKEKGNEIFRNIIESLKNEVQIPAEFR